jgi:predicted ester cyclase
MSITTLQQNKAAVARFNKECIEEGKIASFNELLAEGCINHTAPAGTPNGRDGMIYFLTQVLRTAFPDITVKILDQVAEDDKVTTRKELHGTHKGAFMGVAPTNKQVVIKVIDIVRLHNGQYTDHWGMSNIPEIIAQLSA